MSYESLKLSNQLCFPLYAASRLITKEYQPYLSKLGITYPQYLVLMILWEEDKLPVMSISKKLILNTNTLTPLLQRMEKDGLIKRIKSDEDERKVLISLTKVGIKLEDKAKEIPELIINKIAAQDLKLEDLLFLKETLNSLIEKLNTN